MAIVNGYCSLAQVKSELGISDTADDTLIEQSVEAASRQIDGQCGRRFWQDGTAVAREYWADGTDCVETDDISTVTGLVVKTDVDGDLVYETTLTINTDFIVVPVNAADRVPVWPYTGLLLSGLSTQAFPTGRTPGVQVTAKFGWPAVPDDIEKACIIQAIQLFKAKDAVFGAVSFGDAGVAMRVRSALNPLAQALIDPYAHPSLG